ncbi:unnamed protein product [Brassica napus]|uniref:(rape) hypothetical protein n=1 Tax=Brassica napus TaxID=3708 RepID=A0A816T732_BRANA|nr:unnamed protein product [Brassica napus]
MTLRVIQDCLKLLHIDSCVLIHYFTLSRNISDSINLTNKESVKSLSQIKWRHSWGFLRPSFNIAASQSLRQSFNIAEKVGKAVQKHSHLVIEVDVRVSVRGGEFGKGPRILRCEVTLFTKKHGVVRAEEDAETVYACINLVSTIIERKLRKIKEKDSDHGRHMKGFNRLKVREPVIEPVVEDAVDSSTGEEAEEEDLIKEYFEMPPLTVAEAVEQLELVAHHFYGFQNEKTGEINIVYKRREGGYGLIIPKKDGKAEKVSHFQPSS